MCWCVCVGVCEWVECVRVWFGMNGSLGVSLGAGESAFVFVGVLVSVSWV